MGVSYVVQEKKKNETDAYGREQEEEKDKTKMSEGRKTCNIKYE